MTAPEAAKKTDKARWKVVDMIMSEKLPEALTSLEDEGYEIFHLHQISSYLTVIARLAHLESPHATETRKRK